MSRAIRVDSLPEFTPYRDTGCSLAPHCLTCPFASCRYDAPIKHQRAGERTITVASMATAGADYQAIAQVLGISIRTVYHALERARAEGLAPAGRARRKAAS